MRILHVPFSYPPYRGGAETLFREVSEALVRDGHTVAVCAPRASCWHYENFGLPLEGLPLEHEVINGVEITRAALPGRAYQIGSVLGRLRAIDNPSVRRGLQRLLVAAFRTELARVVDAFKPDIMMTGLHLHPLVRCTLQMRPSLPCPLAWVPALHDGGSPIDHKVKDALARAADVVIALTDREADRYRTEFAVPKDKIFTSWLGAAPPVVQRQRDETPRVLFLGRKEPYKGIDLLLAAMSMVWDKRSDAELVIAGARTPASRAVDASLERVPGRYRERLIVLDDVSEDLKSQLLSNATCVVFPSSWESFGMVVLEAWAHRTPVVAFDTPVLRSYVTHGENGLLVTAGDSKPLADAILTLLNNRELAASMGAAGKAAVEQRFNWAQVARVFLRAYEYAIGTSRQM